jgi:hypothetical protein
VNSWQTELEMHSSLQNTITITELLLSSYQIIQASIQMAQAKTKIQTEILNITTLSLNDTFDTIFQAQNNDTQPLKIAIQQLEQGQEQIKHACKILQNFGPQLITIHPSIIKQFINNFKKVILIWAAQQNDFITEFELVKNEFLATAHQFDDVKKIFEVIVASHNFDNNYLTQGSQTISTTYRKIEKTLLQLTNTRSLGIQKLQILFTTFYKMHYQILYDKLHSQNNLTLSSTQQYQFPDPNDLFIL